MHIFPFLWTSVFLLPVPTDANVESAVYQFILVCRACMLCLSSISFSMMAAS